MKNFSSGLMNILVILGILSIVFIGLAEFYDFPVLSRAIVLGALGVGLLLEGKIRLIINFFRDRSITPIELAHIITITVGFLLIFGAISYYLPNPEMFRQTRLWAVGIALIVVIVQRFIPQKG